MTTTRDSSQNPIPFLPSCSISLIQLHDVMSGVIESASTEAKLSLSLEEKVYQANKLKGQA